MEKRIGVALLLMALGTSMWAQDADKLQIHGFATQGFLFSHKNNFLIGGANHGTVDWDEAVLTVTDRPTPRLRVGIQMHYFEMADLGSDSPTIDWASGDYQFSPYFAVRAGKIKTPIGLFNDTQDLDPVLLWCLLPQSSYQLDNRSLYLSHFGAEVYGTVPLLRGAGNLSYRAFAGPDKVPVNGGIIEEIRQATGLTFNESIPNHNVGVDLRWQTPLKPLMLGASFDKAHIQGDALNGSVDIRANVKAIYAQYEAGKVYAAAEFRHIPTLENAMIGPYPFSDTTQIDMWYVMAAYRPTRQLQVGTYYSQYLSGTENLWYAANNSKDLTFSGRYDVNEYFYAKAETHFVHGEAIGYYQDDNPNGLLPRTVLVVAKLGFSF